MREHPRGGPQKERKGGMPGKWISRISLSACSRQEIEELQSDLASSAECRRQFIEDQIFAQCLREVFRRLDSPGLAVVPASPQSRQSPVDHPQNDPTGEITFLPVSHAGATQHSAPSRRPGLWQAFFAVGIAGALAGYGAARLVAVRGMSPMAEFRHPSGVQHTATGGREFVRAAFRGEVTWAGGKERVFSVQQGRLEVEAPVESGPWRVLTPAGKLQVAPGNSQVEIESGAGLRVAIRKGSAVWAPSGGDPVELGAGSVYIEPK
jgi:hypothetical protein